MRLIIVESPNKAKTIKKILKKDKHEWEVIATQGHIINLPKKELGVEYEDNNFKAKWVIEKGKQEIIKKISQLAQKAEIVYIATDDDREGEKIADDVVKKAKIKNYKRVVFLEITEKEVLKKINEGRHNDKNIVYSATARRLIDRYIGYPISNIIRYAFRKENIPYDPKGVGRVISPALHILVELEEQIEKFVPEKNKKVSLEYIKDGITFRVHNPTSFQENQERELNEFLTALKTNIHIVSHYKRKTADREPPKPLITADLQYGGWYLYGIKPKEVMDIAQHLFELGIITYHRTDSYRISTEVAVEIISYLYEKYGDEYVLSNQREYKNKDNAQNAHEAIRPTTIDEAYHPDNILNIYPDLTEKQKNIYEFIWYRTLATQMKAAIYDVSEVEIDVSGNKFNAKANHQIFDGWESLRAILVKNTSSENDDEEWKNRDIQLPEFVIGEELNVLDIVVYDVETRRPRRYGVGRFIKTLFTNGIARPSTLDGIIDSLEKKGYVEIIKGILYPTELAKKVDEWLVKNVSWLVDTELAKEFENHLDEVEKGKLDFEELIKEYISCIENLEKKFGIDVLHNKPTPAQIEYIRKISQEANIEIDEAILENKKLATEFIDKYIQKISVGKCPVCKNMIKEYDRSYSCTNKNCNFAIWKNSLNTFVENFSLPTNETFKNEFVKALLKYKKIYFEQLVSKKGKKFAAYVVLKQNGKYWNIDLSFPRKEVSQEEIQKGRELLAVIEQTSKREKELEEKVTKLEQERRLLKNAMLKDGLTRAYNRKAMDEDIVKLEKYKTANMSIAFFDGDNFKRVNDTYGHKAGDEVLKTMSDIIHQKMRDFNVRGRLYRYGGEEFVIISLNTKYNDFLRFLDSIRITLQNHKFTSDNGEFSITVSIGFAPPEIVANSNNINEAIKKADEAMYEAKQTGKNKIVIAKTK